jgi:bacterioferritin (cytochrome b1)
MPLTERELWLLNLYRNSELHGSLLMGRLARTVSDPTLLAGATEHCATEARHASLLTETILRMGGKIDPMGETIQQHYSELGGTPSEIVDLLVLSEVLEARVRASYREHLARPNVHPMIHEALTRILEEEEQHSGQGAWMERVLASLPPERVAAAQKKWSTVDSTVTALLHESLAGKCDKSGNSQ